MSDNMIKFERLVKEFDKAVLRIPTNNIITASFQLKEEELFQYTANGEPIYLGYEVDNYNWTEKEQKYIYERTGRNPLNVFRSFFTNSKDILRVYESFNKDTNVEVKVAIKEEMEIKDELSRKFNNLNEFLDFIPKMVEHIVVEEI